LFEVVFVSNLTEVSQIQGERVSGVANVKRLSMKKWTLFSLVFLGLAALASVYSAPSLRTFLTERLYRPVMAAIETDNKKNTQEAKPMDEERVVRGMVVGAAADSQSYVYSGEVRGRYESMLAFQTGGRIIKRNVQLGDVVREGDVLMEIDPKDIKESVAMASAQVRAAESQMRLAEINLGRFQRLYRDGAIPQANLDQIQTQYDAASAAREQASAMRAQSSNQLEYSNLRADKGGVIAGILAEVGQVTGPGIPAIILVRDGDREIEISVPENRIDSLRNIKSLTVSFWALPGIELEGEIRETAPMADPILRTYKTRIRMLNPPPALKLGMTASVRVEENDENVRARLIPLSSVYQEKDKPNVWVVKDGRLELRAVELDGFGNETVRVLKGLDDGDVVVTAGVHKLMAGQKVRVSNGGEL
jgi:RND family efflux transporter MFP subunit